MKYLYFSLLFLLIVVVLPAETLINSNITADETWTLSGSPYVIQANILIYGTLTIEAGVEVKIDPGKYIIVGHGTTSVYAGAISSMGTVSQPVVFTSSQAEPAPGDWDYIQFRRYLVAENCVLNHTHFEYGGNGTNSMVRVGDCSPVFNTCKFSHANNIGLDNESDLESSQFNNCTFEYCGSNPVRMPVNYVNRIDESNVFENNAIQMVQVWDDMINTEQAWVNVGIPFHISENLRIYYTDSPMTIASGCELVFASNKYMKVGHSTSSGYCGGLIANGATFRGETGTPGEWYGVTIEYYNCGASFTNCTFRDGGYTWNTTFRLANTTATLEQCVVANSSGYGVQCSENATLLMNNTEIYNCQGPISMYPNNLTGLGTGNSYHDNADNRIQLPGDTIDKDVTWRNQGIPFKVDGNIFIRGTQIPSVTIQYGSILQFASGQYLLVGHSSTPSYKGKLIANGVTFTGQNEAPGSWVGLSFLSYGSNETILNGCKIQYAGQINNRSVYIEQCDITVTGCTILDGQGDGIYVYDSTAPSITGNQIENCSEYPISMFVNDIRHLGSNNDFTGNGFEVIECRSGTLTSSGTWQDCGVPYYLTGNLTISGTASPYLQIQPGCEIRLAASSMISVGSSSNSSYTGSLCAEEVLFTNAAPEQRINGILFNNYAVDERCVLNHCTIEHAGGSNQAAVIINTSAPTITNCTIRNNDQYGIRVNEAARPVIRDCLIENNASYPITMDALNLHCLAEGNQFVDNNPNRILAGGGTLTSSVTWINQGIPFEITGTITVSASSAYPVLTISNGCTLLFSANTAIVSGSSTNSSYRGGLVANGASFKGLEPTPGYWQGITFNRYALDDSCILNGCVVQHGGSSQANVSFIDTPGLVQRCLIANSANHGIRTYGANADPILSGNFIIMNQAGVLCESSADPLIGGAPGNANAIFGNTSYGVNNTSTNVTVDATYNWWGSADGPSISRTGDLVSDHVSYDPWMTTTLSESPSIFNLVSPENDTTCGRLDILFNWEMATDPTPGDSVLYRLEIRDTPEIGRTVVTVDSIAASTYRVSGELLLDDSNYWWRVIAFDTQGHETYSSQQDWAFTTFVPDPPDDFSLVSPANYETIHLTSIMFEWQAATDPDPGDYLEYTVYLDSTAAFLSPDSIAVTETKVYSPFLRPGSLYYWKVIATDSYGESTSSPMQRFYVDDNAKPRTPIELSITVAGDNLEISWEEIPGADQYHIFKSDAPFSGFSQIATSSVSQFTDTDVDLTQKYFYYIVVEDIENRWTR